MRMRTATLFIRMSSRIWGIAFRPSFLWFSHYSIGESSTFGKSLLNDWSKRGAFLRTSDQAPSLTGSPASEGTFYKFGDRSPSIRRMAKAARGGAKPSGSAVVEGPVM